MPSAAGTTGAPLTSITEAEWTTQVVELARLNGWLVHHSRPAQDRRGRWSTPLQGDPGLPDLILARPPRLLFAELKRQSAPKPSLEQARWLTALRANAGAEVYVWRPADIERVAEVLGRRGWPPR